MDDFLTLIGTNIITALVLLWRISIHEGVIKTLAGNNVKLEMFLATIQEYSNRQSFVINEQFKLINNQRKAI